MWCRPSPRGSTAAIASQAGSVARSVDVLPTSIEDHKQGSESPMRRRMAGTTPRPRLRGLAAPATAVRWLCSSVGYSPLTTHAWQPHGVDKRTKAQAEHPVPLSPASARGSRASVGDPAHRFAIKLAILSSECPPMRPARAVSTLVSRDALMAHLFPFLAAASASHAALPTQPPTVSNNLHTVYTQVEPYWLAASPYSALGVLNLRCQEAPALPKLGEEGGTGSLSLTIVRALVTRPTAR